MQPWPGTAEHLAQVRAECERLTPQQTLDQVRRGSRLFDTRPEFQRRSGSRSLMRPHQQRLHPETVDHGVRWIILCTEGLSSALAAASLRRLGLHHATYVIGGF